MSQIDVGRFLECYSPTLVDLVEATLDRFSSMTESPIEAMFGAAFWLGLSSQHALHPERKYLDTALCLTQDDPAFLTATLAITPQFRWNSYRIDWAVRSASHLYFIECDGHSFHERTPEQAAKDRQKDREFQQAGIPILRFTGSEINHDPFACVIQTIEFIGDHRRSRGGA